MKTKFSLLGRVLMITAALALMVPLAAQATAYTWTGAGTGANLSIWNTPTNWGNVAFPNAYTDTATIASGGANRPVQLSTTALLGVASGNALTIGGASSGTTTNSLDILSGGLLGMQGGISIGTRRTLQIESGGILRNDAASSATTYAITGAPILNGGTMSSLNGGGWSLSSALNGWGTISAPITTSSTISANVANQTLHITGNVSVSAQRALGAGSTYVSGALLSIEGGTITGLGGIGGNAITNYNKVDLRGHFDGISLFNDAAYNLANFGGWNYFNLTGNSTWNNGSLNIMNFNGYQLDVTGTVGNGAASGLGLNVGTGTLNHPGSTAATLSGDIMTLSGGKITSSASTFNIGTQINGYGTLSGLLNITGGIIASGGSVGTPQTLTVDGTTGTGITGSSASWGASANTTLDLQGKIGFGLIGGLLPGAGAVALDGTTIAVGTTALSVGPGAVNVTNNSFLTSTGAGRFNSDANLTVQSGKTLNASGATFTNSNLGTVNVLAGATANWGDFTNNGVYKSDPSTQTFNNLTVGSTGSIQAQAGDLYKVSGNFTNNSTQNTAWNTSAATLAFFTGTSSAHNVALAGADAGAHQAGYTNNFAWGTLDLTGQTLALSDGNATPGGALYVGTITGETIASGQVTDITGNGFNIYYEPGLNLDLHGQTFSLLNGGKLAPVPVPPSVLLLGSGLLGLVGLGWRRRKNELVS